MVVTSLNCFSHKMVPQEDRTLLNYHCLGCKLCVQQFNQRTGTLFNFLALSLQLYLRLSSGWEYRFTLLITDMSGRERREKFDRSWYVDEIDVKISGRGIIFLKLSIIMGI